jgi:hypothetical protein
LESNCQEWILKASERVFILFKNRGGLFEGRRDFAVENELENPNSEINQKLNCRHHHFPT